MVQQAMLSSDLLLSGIGVRVGEAQLLSGVDLRLRAGELVGLIGPSGAGKSTLIRVLLGLRAPSEGKVSLDGRPVREAGPIGYVPQEDALHLTLTVQEALGYAAALRLHALSADERAARLDRVLRDVGLDERREVRIGRLSGGQRKRVSVAMELLTEPPVLILDEPTSGLDPGMEAQMMGLFHSVAGRGRVVLVSTHAMQSLDRCDALVVLVGGRLAWFGPPHQTLSYFETDTWVGLFEVLGRHAPLVWAKKYQSSPMRTQFAQRTRPPEGGSNPPTPPLAIGPGKAPADPAAKARAELDALKAKLRGGEP